MPRQIKNSCDYFSHDNGMRNHKKVKALRTKFGITGYALWNMVLEHLTGSDGNVFPNTDLEFEMLSGDFGVPADEIRAFVGYCLTIELLFINNGFINSDSLDERLAPVYEKRQKAKELSKQQQRSSGRFCEPSTGSFGESVTETPQSKVKESKGKKSKVNNTDAVPAPIELWPSFDDFWDKYDKKQDRPKCEKKFKKIDQGAREKIMQHLEAYVLSTPDKQFRKNPLTYLNNQAWENEVIFKNETNGRNGQTSQDRTAGLLEDFAKRHGAKPQ